MCGGEGGRAGASFFPPGLCCLRAVIPCIAPRAAVHELGPPRAVHPEPGASKDGASAAKSFPGLYAYSAETNSRPDPLSSFSAHTNPRLPSGDNATSLPWENSPGGFIAVGFPWAKKRTEGTLFQTPPASFPSFPVGINMRVCTPYRVGGCCLSCSVRWRKAGRECFFSPLVSPPAATPP